MSPSLPQSRLLIADDHPENILLLMDNLDEGCSVIVAKDGHKAVEQAFAHQPDLIMLDVMMPGMDGFEVCAILKSDSRTKEIPIIFITAMRDAADEEKGLRLGAIDYIRKPINPSVTRVRIRNHLALRRKTGLLEELALLDGLTEINNRRWFDDALSREWMRARRTEKPLSLALLDIDHFKTYNDTYGHAQGDQCLIQVAGVLRHSMKRGGDSVARYGGEEFVVLAPDTPREAAFRLLQEITAGVAALRIPHAASPVADHVTISAGIACCLPAEQDPALCLLEQADEALYQAKASGRNRVVALP
ncbi:diguanylate cyclase domain-containing protein [Halochromatium glycolicum]|jgi:diguanylate cyclase (GGDEF)-like protein|uniref:diguanylate cyclase n=1 Tax=Halochromatium glycolicum TaxID=85075 RepID=A0AAJ0U2T3_9GAMM|nr:diguanylate cyclase [Halochromatium glycolicum]MBK1704038.1 diguanylate cyclase response regulator [Halochromatium glycolicum]